MIAISLSISDIDATAGDGGTGATGYAYKRPGGVDTYKRPGGTDTYKRP
jgi:hypothetical protein